MKKIVALSLIAAVSLGLSACKKTESNETVAVNETDTSTTMNETGTDLNAATTAGNEATSNVTDNGAAPAENATAGNAQ